MHGLPPLKNQEKCMKLSDRKEFSALITDVLAFYRQDASSFALSVWWQACAEFDLEQVRKALTAHAMDPEHGTFAPKPADLVRVLQGTRTDRANIAWGKVYEAMQRVGAYTDVIFDDAAIHAVIEDLGGWPKLCRCNMDELGFIQSRFMKSYQAYAAQVDFEYPRQILGDRSSDADYAKRGLPPPKPALIGSPEGCRAVLMGGTVGGKTRISFAPIQVLLHKPPANDAFDKARIEAA
jgi:Domain of unknown function (DUF6475)